MPTENVVTIVHGTWGRWSKWHRPESLLYKKIESSVAEVTIDTFCWSGLNSAKAREKGASRLAEKVREKLQEHPGACHFVIGHSHGGNVALRAVQQIEGYGQINIACLSTPFLTVREGLYSRYARRRQPDEMKIMTTGVIIAGIGLCLWAAVHLQLNDSVIGQCFIMLGIPLGLLALVFLFFESTTKAIKYIENAYPKPPAHASLLLLASEGDEALRIILANERFSKAASALSRRLARLQGRFETFALKGSRYMLGGAAGVFIVSLPLIFAGTLGYDDWAHALPHGLSGSLWFLARCLLYTVILTSASVLIPMCAAMLVWGLILLMFPVLGFSVAVAILPLDLNAALASFSHDIRVAPVPNHRGPLRKVPWPAKGLGHATHSSPEALDILGGWMQSINRANHAKAVLR